ncbi:alpha/beta hydrolase [Actinomadura madurae]|uniref:alpha/beta hydrolase n=1 Tax=Actinomadura madurae TaxID=1993 RepID=UPI0020D22760|nr:alpha/beta hydrolase fold domain-containing protein [Actinomadura madurae]MCP9969568.1 alpha/beta hydrolase [Actinomadura madurae]
MDGPSVRSRAISNALRLGVRPFLNYLPGPGSIRTARSTVDVAALLMRHGSRVRFDSLDEPPPEDAGDRPVRGEWVISRDVAEDDVRGAVLYLHGGGYVACSPRTHRPITSRLALDTGLPVVAARYRLAPEHQFPAPLEDALAAYRWLLARGVPAARHRARGRLGPAGTSPPCWPARSAGWACRNRPACSCSPLGGPHLRAVHPGAGPRARPLHQRRVGAPCRAPRRGAAGFDDPRLALLSCAWDGIPPVLIQVGGAEVLRTEGEAFAEALQSAGADCELEIWNGQMHVFQILNRVLPEAGDAMRSAARFVGHVTSTASPGNTAAA